MEKKNNIGQSALLLVIALLLLCCLGGQYGVAQVETTSNESASREELQSRLNSLETSIKEIDQQTRETKNNLADLNNEIISYEGVLNFLRFSVPFLPIPSIFTQITFFGYLCALLSLFYILIFKRNLAGKLLSLRYPFKLSVNRSEETTTPLASGWMIFWVILFLFILLAIAVPVFAEDEFQGQMQEAMDFINLTPLERAISILELAEKDEKISFSLNEDTIEYIEAKSLANKHAPLLNFTADQSFATQKGTFHYQVTLATLYEAAGRIEAGTELKKGVELFLSEPYNIRHSSVNNIANFLWSHKIYDSLQDWLSYGFDSADEVNELSVLMELALKAKLNYLARTKINESIKRFKTVNDSLILIELLYTLGDTAKISSALEDLIKKADFEQLLVIAEKASGYNVKSVSLKALATAIRTIANEEKLDELLTVAIATNQTSQIMKILYDAFGSNLSIALWEVTPRFPASFDTRVYDEEKVSLASLVGAYLLKTDDKQSLRNIFEYPVSQELKKILGSHGEESAINLNNLYALSKYYDICNTSDELVLTNKMIIVQRSRRGLDSPLAKTKDDNVANLALLMEVQRLEKGEKARRASLAILNEKIMNAEAELSEARANTALMILRTIAQGLLCLIALWIAFSRALVAAKQSLDYRFSHFCWTFLETVGIELCCTLLLIVPGVISTLIGQDRLKHLQISELNSP